MRIGINRDSRDNVVPALSGVPYLRGMKGSLGTEVHDASVEVLARGLWKPNGDEETEMQKSQKKRSLGTG